LKGAAVVGEFRASRAIIGILDIEFF
jgi:hypothetical protein